MIDVTKVGIIGNGRTHLTSKIQHVIDQCAAAGGGVVYFPEGRYLTGTIVIKSNVSLRFHDKAVLLGSDNPADYQNLDPFIDGSGNPMGHALIVAMDAENIGIEGRGTIDGQVAQVKSRQKKYTMRPFLIRIIRCKNVSVRDVHLRNAGAWTLNFFQSEDSLVENLNIRTRYTGVHNNDGVNIDSCQRICVRNCDIISGDDALVIKSTSCKPCRDIIASGCRLSTGANAVKLGTESIGGFENIEIYSCQVFHTGMAGIALYAVDGGDLRNVRIDDVKMDGVAVAISIRLGSRLKTFRESDKPKLQPGQLAGVSIRNINARNIAMIGMLINGVTGHPVEDLTLENVDLHLPGGGSVADASIKLPECQQDYPEFDTFGPIMPAYGMYLRHVRGIDLKQVQFTLDEADARPEGVMIDVQNLNRAEIATQPIPARDIELAAV